MRAHFLLRCLVSSSPTPVPRCLSLLPSVVYPLCTPIGPAGPRSSIASPSRWPASGVTASQVFPVSIPHRLVVVVVGHVGAVTGCRDVGGLLSGCGRGIDGGVLCLGA